VIGWKTAYCKISEGNSKRSETSVTQCEWYNSFHPRTILVTAI
jgi:hypothetical protein